jgi:hypothetical protein
LIDYNKPEKMNVENSNLKAIVSDYDDGEDDDDDMDVKNMSTKITTVQRIAAISRTIRLIGKGKFLILQ